MNHLTIRNFITGVSFIIVGLFFIWYPSNDNGLFLYFLLVFGVWELGEGLSNILDGSWKWESEEEKTLEQVKYEFRSEIIHLTIPIGLSIITEVFLLNTEFKIYTLVAYLLVWIVYIGTTLVYYSYEPVNHRLKARRMRRLSKTYQSDNKVDE